MKRIILLILVTILLFSCSNSGEIVPNKADETTTNDAIETTIVQIREDIPVSDFNGYEFRILTRDADHHLKEVQAEMENGDILNDVVYRRNRAVEDKLNINIKIITTPEVTEQELTQYFSKSVLADEDAFDLALPHTVNAGTAATQGIMFNWHNVPYIDFNKPWWNKVIVDELTINGKLFLAMSDFGISAIDYTWVMLYNYKIGNDYDIPNLFDIVKAGNWTIDLFQSYIKNVSGDLNGDGIFDHNDFYGFITHFNSAIQNWMFALDQKVTKMDADGYPQLIVNTEKMVSIVEKVYDILFTGNNTLYLDSSNKLRDALNPIGHDQAVATKFESDTVMFAAIRMQYIELLRNMQSEYGIIPFPKYDSKQPAYYTHVDGHAPLMSLPLTITNVERIGIIIEALSAETYREVVPAVMDLVLQSKFARDAVSYEMLELILDGRVYTFGYIYDGWKGMQWALTNLMGSKSKDFASYYQKGESGALAQIKTIMDAFEDIK
ncbi:MAG: hypothetical protein FWF15_07290 [Oscillospiraceae bacterium]|nr:hypothetical protein [Oscillospiraceae bacterium]